ncbi:hypothetical protein RSOL_208280 [Rhizoctonia solani AG-3 Rhs1AP]|uniref:Uncharacterized protein n=1 Tax=Rhizoctonia solani AG-3 Rhs1AP TaxID=1086054 RepID=X8J473_9AGAM|nr:hypothetical protein RSOL_208280 [Rhizoctonia solani AG-3 Rhs1AP]
MSAPSMGPSHSFGMMASPRLHRLGQTNASSMQTSFSIVPRFSIANLAKIYMLVLETRPPLMLLAHGTPNLRIITRKILSLHIGPRLCGRSPLRLGAP